jgi:hypothetical protein
MKALLHERSQRLKSKAQVDDVRPSKKKENNHADELEKLVDSIKRKNQSINDTRNKNGKKRRM